jgi:NAD(P)-dependent dehydrogenase (short-subunit alcohol dehydrogenase family)
MGSDKSIAALFTQIESLYGAVDILINNAGIFSHTHIEDEDAFLAWNRILSVNLTGAYLATKYALPLMQVKTADGHGYEKKDRCILNIASTRAIMSEPDTVRNTSFSRT